MALKTFEKGKYEDADSYYRRTLEICREKNVPQERSVVRFCKAQRALTLLELSRIKEAEHISGEVLKHTQDTVGVTCAQTLMCATNLAIVLRSRGQYARAYGILVNHLEDFTDPPFWSIYRLRALGVVANLLKDLGLFLESERWFRLIVWACHRDYQLGRNHPFTLNQESDLSAVTSRMNSYTAAEMIVRSVIKNLAKIRGPVHPDTLRACRRLGEYHLGQGRIEEAQPALETCFNIQYDLLSMEHPETLATYSALAMAQASDSDPGSLRQKLHTAEKMITKVIDLRRQAFNDENHADYIWATVILKGIKQAQIKLIDKKPIRPIEVIREATRSYHQQKLEQNRETYDQSEFKINDPSHEETKNILTKMRNGTLTGDDSHSAEKMFRLNAASGQHLQVAEIIRLNFEYPQPGFDVNAKGGYWGTALEAAASTGKLEVVKVLLSRDEIKVDEGNTGPLTLACFFGHAKIVEQLLSHGANVNESRDNNPFGNPVLAALAGGYVDVARNLMFNHHAEIHPADRTHVLFGTSLQEAVAKESGTAVKFLLDNGADLSTDQSIYGVSPLGLAVFAPEDIFQTLWDQRNDIPEHARREAADIANRSGQKARGKKILDRWSQNSQDSGYMSIPDLAESRHDGSAKVHRISPLRKFDSFGHLQLTDSPVVLASPSVLAGKHPQTLPLGSAERKDLETQSNRDAEVIEEKRRDFACQCPSPSSDEARSIGVGNLNDSRSSLQRGSSKQDLKEPQKSSQRDPFQHDSSKPRRLSQSNTKEQDRKDAQSFLPSEVTEQNSRKSQAFKEPATIKQDDERPQSLSQPEATEQGDQKLQSPSEPASTDEPNKRQSRARSLLKKLAPKDLRKDRRKSKVAA